MVIPNRCLFPLCLKTSSPFKAIALAILGLATAGGALISAAEKKEGTTPPAAVPLPDNTRQPGNGSTPASIVVPTPDQPIYSKLVYPGPDGKLIYKPDPNGDFIPDFSMCGYMGGGVALPVLPVKVTVQAGDGKTDDRARIQAAIDAVSKLPPDAHGFRGAVLLKKGHYRVGDSLYLNVGESCCAGRGRAGMAPFSWRPKKRPIRSSLWATRGGRRNS